MRRRSARLGLTLLLTFAVVACSGGPPKLPAHQADPAKTARHGTYKLGAPYQIAGIWYYPEYDPAYRAVGIASWYGDAFHGRPTANGEVFDKGQISAAHPTLPMPSLVEVTNLENGRSIELRVNDRGPFHDDRLIDLSQAAARELGFEGQGLARVEVRFLALLPANGTPPVAGTTTRPATALAAAGSGTQPARPAAAAPKTVAAAAAGRGCAVGDTHFVQVAALSRPANAANLAARLNGLGRVEIDAASPPLSRVRLGPYPSRRDAFGKLAQVHELGFRDALVVSCS